MLTGTTMTKNKHDSFSSSRMCIEDGVPHHRKKKTPVKVHVGAPHPDLDSFCRPPLAESRLPSFHSGPFPVDVMVRLLYVGSNAILLLTSAYGLPVLTHPHFQCSFGFPNIYLLTITTGYLIHHACLLLLGVYVDETFY